MRLETRQRIVDIARKLPVFLIPKPLAEEIIKATSDARSANHGKGIEYGFIVPTRIMDDRHGMTRAGVSTLYSVRTRAMAEKAFGKYTSEQARNKLIEGVSSWHAQVELVSRISEPSHALEVMRSGKITDHIIKAVLAASTNDVEYAKQTLLSGEFAGGMIFLECALSGIIQTSKDAKEILINANLSEEAQKVLARKVDDAVDAMEILKSGKGFHRGTKEILLSKINPNWHEQSMEAAIARL